MKKAVLLFLLLTPLILFAQNVKVPDSFKHLKQVKISPSGVVCAYLPQTYEAYVDTKHLLKDFAEEGDGKAIGVVKVAGTSESKVLLAFTYGPSEDPSFVFFKEEENNLRHLFSLPGHQIFIPGNGSIYVSGHTNNMFDKRRKLKFVNDTIQEVAQPLYHVGLKTKTLKTVSLYGEISLQNKVATLPADASVEVVAAEYKGDCKYFLIRTSFGLIGWWKLDNYYSEEIEGVSFAGD